MHSTGGRRERERERELASCENKETTGGREGERWRKEYVREESAMTETKGKV